jgi:hypothetical protein
MNILTKRQPKTNRKLSQRTGKILDPDHVIQGLPIGAWHWVTPPELESVTLELRLSSTSDRLGWAIVHYRYRLNEQFGGVIKPESAARHSELIEKLAECA